MNKPTVIYHSADFDGIFCREIAKHFMPDANLIGWNFGDPLIPYPNEGQVYVLDLSPDCLAGLPHRATETLVWIDHHKTSIEKWPAEIPGYRIDGVAACRLALQWFNAESRLRAQASKDLTWIQRYPLPGKQDFLDRNVSEPTAVRLAGEYDIWDKRDPNADTLQYALRAVDPDWCKLLTDDSYTESLLAGGRVVQAYEQKQNASLANSKTWVMEWEGLRFLCLNSARFNSMVFEARDLPETGHDALLGFCYTGKLWTVSLYHAKHRKDLDLSEIAKKHGGGGHRGACGFTASKLPFPL